MPRSRILSLLTIATLGAGCCSLALAEGGQLTERTKIELAGAAGKMAKMFAGQSARGDGLERTIAVTPTRKGVLTGETREVFDLEAEAMWKISKGERKCVKTTFAEIRERWESLDLSGAQTGGNDEIRAADSAAPPVTYVVKTETETGKPRTVAGYQGLEKIVRLTVHQEGMSLEEGGGSVVEMTLIEIDQKIPALDALRNFDRAYGELMAETVGFDLDSIKQIVLGNPAVGEALAELRSLGLSSDSTILSTTMTVSTVSGPGQASADDEGDDATPTSAKGMAGRLAAKMLKKRKARSQEKSGDAERRQVYSSEHALVDAGPEPDRALLRLPDNCPS